MASRFNVVSRRVVMVAAALAVALVARPLAAAQALPSGTELLAKMVAAIGGAPVSAGGSRAAGVAFLTNLRPCRDRHVAYCQSGRLLLELPYPLLQTFAVVAVRTTG